MADLTRGWYGCLTTIVTASKEYAVEQLSTWSLKKASQETVRQILETFNLRTSVAAVAVLLTVAAGIHTASSKLINTQNAYKVFVDGKYVGTVSQLDAVKDKAVSLNEQDKHTIVSWSPVRIPSTQVMDTRMVLTAMEDSIHKWISAVVIRVDGQNIATVADMDAATKLLDLVKQKLAAPEGTVDSIKFMQSISFQATEVDQTQLLSQSEVVAELMKGTEPPKPYIVSRGDSLWSIATDHNVKVDQIKSLNPSVQNEDAIKEGQQLLISSNTPLLTVQSVEEMDRQVDIPYDTKYQDDPNLDVGQSKVITEGVNGVSQQHVRVTKENGKVTQTEVLSEHVLKDKTDQVVARGTHPTALPVSSGDWIWPTTTHFVSSPFGEWRGNERHPGIDLAGPTGSPIYASNSGTVIFAGWDSGGYGNCVRISHGNGIVSVYGHMSAISVSAGQIVAKGQQIGSIGMTGEATGPHLHYEIRQNGVAVNPAPYM